MKRKKIKSIGYGFYCILMIILSVLGWILYNLGNWVLDTWGLLSIDEIIFHLKVPLEGTNSDVVIDGINACVPLAVLVLFTIVLMIIGLKTILGSAEEIAEYKKELPKYVIGILVLLSGSIIPELIYKIMK